MLYSDISSWFSVRPAEGYYTSEVSAAGSMPVRTFLPTGYEPRYGYPLLVFFHNHGGDEEQTLRLAPRLSRRNFISIGLRGPKLAHVRRDGRFGYTWGSDATDAQTEEYVFGAIEQTQETYNIHPGRIYLAGVCEGATLPYRLGLTFPDRFAGIISLNGAITRHQRPLLRLPEARKLRVFIGHGIANATIPLSMAQDDFRLLYTAGLQVDFHKYMTNHKPHSDMLRDINRWIIGHCSGTAILR